MFPVSLDGILASHVLNYSGFSLLTDIVHHNSGDKLAL